MKLNQPADQNDKIKVILHKSSFTSRNTPEERPTRNEMTLKESHLTNNTTLETSLLRKKTTSE
jgi:hypothetical protein